MPHFFDKAPPELLPRRRDGVQAGASFDIMSKDAALKGDVVFVQQGGQVFQIMGIGTSAGWGAHQPVIDRTRNSFDGVTDPAVLNKQAGRIEIIRLPSEMTLEQFYARYPTPLELDEVGRMNRREAGEVIPAGTLLKHVAGG